MANEINAGWEIAVAVGGSFSLLVGAIVYLVKHYLKKDTDTTDKLLEVVKSNTSAFEILTGSINKNTDYTEKSTARIEQLYIETLRHKKDD